MRIAILKIFFPLLSLLSFINPFYGILNYSFISIIRPEQLTYGNPIIGKVFAFAIFCLLISCIVKKEKILESCREKFFIYFILFIFFISVSTFINPYTDFSETKGSIYYLQQFPQILIYCLCLYTILKRLSPKDFELYLTIITALFTFMGLWGIEQYLRGNTLIENLFGTSLVDRCAITTVYVLYFPLILYLYNKNCGFKKLIYLLSLIVFIIVIILTQSRAGYLGFIVSIIVLLVNSKNKIKYTAVLLTLLAIFIIVSPDRYIDRIKSIQWENVQSTEISDYSSASRIVLWQIALKIFRDNPILGVGNFNYSKAGATYYQEFSGKINPELLTYIFDFRELRLSHCHNTFLNLLAEGGLLSFIPFILLIIIPLKKWIYLKKSSVNNHDTVIFLNYINSGILGFTITSIFANLIFIDFIYWNLTISYLISKKIDNVDCD